MHVYVGDGAVTFENLVLRGEAYGKKDMEKLRGVENLHGKAPPTITPVLRRKGLHPP